MATFIAILQALKKPFLFLVDFFKVLYGKLSDTAYTPTDVPVKPEPIPDKPKDIAGEYKGEKEKNNENANNQSRSDLVTDINSRKK